MKTISEIIENEDFTIKNITRLITAKGTERATLLKSSAKVKKEYVDNITYFRGLIEISNNCMKNCLYCGIRKDNKFTKRYFLSDDEILDAVKYAYQNNYASIVLQSGENTSKNFTDRIANLLLKIQKETDNKLGITLSLGEQSYETYKLWRECGAKRYLLRIESSNPDLYYKIHPFDINHNFENRVQCLRHLKELDYQVGTGVMIGLPFQTATDLANDLLFMKKIDIDMCGMGPYIEHQETPLYEFKDTLLPQQERFDLTLNMIAILRLMMKDINIAATTAMQSIDKLGREKAIMVGANVIMPNVTPGRYRDDYDLYENKPCTDEDAADCLNCVEARIAIAGDKPGLGVHGDSLHYRNRINSN